MKTIASTRPATMSLQRKLWLAILLVLGLAFCGTFVLSTLAAKRYFEQQLFVKNVDNATSLALSMSQMPKDMVSIELLLAAQFDAGHYRLIRLLDPEGRVLLERQNLDEEPVAPQWFLNMVPLDVATGVADVQDGWNQFGRLELESHDRYAYAELWAGSRKMLLWFVALALMTGVVGAKLMRLILRPLAGVVVQAEAIGARRFITIPEPPTQEFRSLVRAMNTLSGRVKSMLQQESQRVASMRLEAQFDPVTGLLNRDGFFDRLDSLLSREDRESAGVFVILRFTQLREFNLEIGHEALDAMLRRASSRLQQIADQRPTGWTVGRLSGGDFAVLAPGETDAEAIAALLASEWHLAMDRPDSASDIQLPVGATSFSGGQDRSPLLARADDALAAAEETGRIVVREEPKDDALPLPKDLPGWRAMLDKALEPGTISLGRYPVVSYSGELLHYETPVRLNHGGRDLVAGQVLAWVSRLGWMTRLDELVLDTVLRQLKQADEPLALNLSPEAICEPSFVQLLVRRLSADPDLARRLWVEVPEHGALHHLPEFKDLCLALKPLHCRIGLKHAGPGFARIGELHDVGLDHLKLDASLVRGVDQNLGNQAFLRGVCMVVHSIGLLVIAEGVNTQAEQDMLLNIGVDGVTGPAVRQP